MTRRALLLDAGNTVVFLDHAAVAACVGGDSGAIRTAERVAKETNSNDLNKDAIHERGWRVFMRTLLTSAGIEGDLEELSLIHI